MSKDEKYDSISLLLAVIVILGIIVITFLKTAIAIMPIILISCFIYYKVKFTSGVDALKKQIEMLREKGICMFWLSTEEKNQFMNYLNEKNEISNEIIKLKRKIMDISWEISELNSEGDSLGIRRNKDGRFSIRSNIGRKLRNQIEEYEISMNKYKNTLNYLHWRLDDIETSQENIKNTPRKRFEAYMEEIDSNINKITTSLKTLKAIKYSIGVYFVAFMFIVSIFYNFSFKKLFIAYYGFAFNLLFEIFPIKEVVDISNKDYYAILSITLLSLFSFFIVWKKPVDWIQYIPGIELLNKIDPPPEVTEENIDYC